MREEHAQTIHPAWVRVTHWINALAMLVMIGSGWQIYNASPLFDFAFPRGIALGNWLGGALLWHFAAMWVLAINGLVYVTLGFVTGRFRRKLAADPSARGGRRRKGRADLQALARRHLASTTRCRSCFMPASSCVARRHRAVRPVDLEAGAVAGTDDAVRRLRRRPLRPFLRHGGDRRLSRRSRRAGAARAEEPARDDRRQRRRQPWPAFARSFPASTPSC